MDLMYKAEKEGYNPTDGRFRLSPDDCFQLRDELEDMLRIQPGETRYKGIRVVCDKAVDIPELVIDRNVTRLVFTPSEMKRASLWKSPEDDRISHYGKSSIETANEAIESHKALEEGAKFFEEKSLNQLILEKRKTEEEKEQERKERLKDCPGCGDDFDPEGEETMRGEGELYCSIQCLNEDLAQ
jgi:hypothetical protein